MLFLHAKANFGRFQPLAAGGARSTLRFMSHSSAYGLALNIAGIDYRHNDYRSSFTAVKKEIPRLNIAVGVVGKVPSVIETFELVHRYGNSKGGTKQVGQPSGSPYKNLLTPVKVEYLQDLDLAVCVNGNEEVEDLMRRGLRGEHERYGVPFAGTNSHFFDVLEERSLPARWLTKFDPTNTFPDFFFYSTLWVDRPQKGKVTASNELYSAGETFDTEVPPEAWVSLPPDVVKPQPKQKKAKS